jgi:hypothetical protein
MSGRCHEVHVGGERLHLGHRIARIAAMRISLDKFPNGEAIRRCSGGDGSVVGHGSLSCRGSLQDGPRFKKRLDPERSEFAADAGMFESAERRLLIVKHAVDRHSAGSDL